MTIKTDQQVSYIYRIAKSYPLEDKNVIVVIGEDFDVFIVTITKWDKDRIKNLTFYRFPGAKMLWMIDR